jgi:hypothetical protein
MTSFPFLSFLPFSLLPPLLSPSSSCPFSGSRQGAPDHGCLHLLDRPLTSALPLFISSTSTLPPEHRNTLHGTWLYRSHCCILVGHRNISHHCLHRLFMTGLLSSAAPVYHDTSCAGNDTSSLRPLHYCHRMLVYSPNARKPAIPRVTLPEVRRSFVLSTITVTGPSRSADPG